MDNKQNTNTTRTLIDESSEQVTVDQALGTTPQGDGSTTPAPIEASKTNLSAAQQASKAVILSRMAQRCRDFRTARQAESRTIHGPMVGDIADLYVVLMGDGLTVANKVIREFFESVWIDETEPSRDRHIKFGKGHKTVTVSSLAPVSKQYAQIWNDCGRWTAALRDEGNLVNTVLRAGTERGGEKVKGERDWYAQNIAPSKGVKIGTTVYWTPYDALMAGVGFHETHIAFRTQLRPTYIDLSPFFTQRHNLEAAALQAVGHKVTLKVKDKAGVGRRKNVAIGTDKMLEVQTVLGILAHLHHSGSLSGIRSKIEEALENPAELLTPAMEARFKALAAAEDEDGADTDENEDAE